MSSTPEWDPDEKELFFMMRNDLHIFIDDRLFFGENTHPSSQISAYQSRFSFGPGPTSLVGESVLMYEHRSRSRRWLLQLFLSTKRTFFRRINCLGLAVQANIWKLLISGTGGRKEFAACHLQVDLVDSQYRPIPQLLTDHLAQGVWANCVYPGWEDGDQQLPARLNPLAEDMERTSSGYDERQEGGHTPTASFPKMPPLDLDSDEETGHTDTRSTNLA
ncbi:hypothetical protein BGY98DRAFT_1189831 [Russula aff. rugulosa BPL654]|nr:hypothetical protein BGY98DRAFT_1189831 [Russula aff. rugulosa BPL654]